MVTLAYDFDTTSEEGFVAANADTNVWTSDKDPFSGTGALRIGLVTGAVGTTMTAVNALTPVTPGERFETSLKWQAETSVTSIYVSWDFFLDGVYVSTAPSSDYFYLWKDQVTLDVYMDVRFETTVPAGVNGARLILSGQEATTDLADVLVDEIRVNPAVEEVAYAGPDQVVAAGSTVTLVGTPPGGKWSQETGSAVTFSAPTTTAEDTRVTFSAANASTTTNEARSFRYTYSSAAAVIDATSVTITPSSGEAGDAFSATATITATEAVTLSHLVIGTRKVGQTYADPTAGDFNFYTNVSIPAGGTYTIPGSSRTFSEAGDFYAYVAWAIDSVWDRDATTTAPFSVTAPVVATVGGLPLKVVGEWQSVFTSDPPTLQALVDRAPEVRPNLVSLAAAQSGGSGTGTLIMPNGDGSIVNATMVANAKAAGIKVVLLLGAAGFAGSLLDATDRDEMIASTKTIVDTFGLNGVDFNLEGGSSQWAITPAVEVMRALKAHYGADFIINAAPRPYEVRSSTAQYTQFLVALQNEGLLDCAFLQFYDANAWSDPAFLKSQGTTDLNGLIGFGVPADHLGVACITQPGYDVNGDGIGDGNTPEAYLALYKNVPGLRGVQHWWTKFGTAVSEAYCRVMNPEVRNPWRGAKDSYSEAKMRAAITEITGPRIAISGTHAGGTITTQAQCDDMRGKTVTGNVMFDAPSGTTLVVSDTVFLGGRVEADWNTSQVLRHCLIDGNDQTYSASHIYYRGKWRLENVEIRRSQDAGKVAGGAEVTYRDVFIHEPSQFVGTLSGNETHQDGFQQMAGVADLERVFIDYSGNHSGGQGVIIKADSGTIVSTRIVDSHIKAGGNNLTFEPHITNGSPGSIDLGTGIYRNVFTPAPDMLNVLSLYEPNGAMTEPARSQLLGSTFFVAEKNGATLYYKNGITKAVLDAVVPLAEEVGGVKHQPRSAAYVDYHVTSATASEIVLNDSTDYNIIFDVPQTRKLRVVGGRHIKMDRAEFNIKVDNSNGDTSNLNNYNVNCGLEIDGTPGVVRDFWINRLLVHGAHALDGIRVRARQNVDKTILDTSTTTNDDTTYYLQNSRLECNTYVQGATDVYHSDGLQNWAGAAAVHRYNVTIVNPYQVSMYGDGNLQGKQGEWVDENVNFRGDTAVGQMWKGLLFSDGPQNSRFVGPFVAVKDTVWYQIGPSVQWSTLWDPDERPNYPGGAFYSSTPVGTDATGQFVTPDASKWPTATFSDGQGGPWKVRRGIPPGGDYCPVGVAGMSTGA